MGLSDGAGDPLRSPVRSASVAAAYLGQVQANNDVNSRVTPSPSNNSNNNSTTNTRSPHRQHQQRSSSSSSKKESSHKSSNRWARPGAADGDSSLTVSSASSTGHATTVTSRSRSPPVVTIAPTLSLSNLSHYQDSRKVRRASFHPSLPFVDIIIHSLTPHSHRVFYFVLFPFFRLLMDLRVFVCIFFTTGLRSGNTLPHGALFAI